MNDRRLNQLIDTLEHLSQCALGINLIELGGLSEVGEEGGGLLVEAAGLFGEKGRGQVPWGVGSSLEQPLLTRILATSQVEHLRRQDAVLNEKPRLSRRPREVLN
jgi:hypothetical protein